MSAMHFVGITFISHCYYQVIPDHGNRQKGRTLFSRYLFKTEWVKYINFYQVFEISSWQTDRDPKTARKAFNKPPRDINVIWIARSPLLPTVHILVRMVFGDSPGIAWIPTVIYESCLEGSVFNLSVLL